MKTYHIQLLQQVVYLIFAAHYVVVGLQYVVERACFYYSKEVSMSYNAKCVSMCLFFFSLVNLHFQLNINHTMVPCGIHCAYSKRHNTFKMSLMFHISLNFNDFIARLR